MRLMLSLVLTLVGCLSAMSADNKVLMVADEFPAMKVLAAALKAGDSEGALSCEIVEQTAMPADLGDFRAVFVYIHRALNPGPEQAFIRYARAGGRLILLHHSISSGKRKNRDWFPFLGVNLRPGAVEEGGYKWIEGVSLQIYELKEHYVTTHQVPWPDRVKLAEGADVEGRPAVTLEDSEVYLNHSLKGEHRLLLGLRYEDANEGKRYVQQTAGWYRAAGKGWVFYFMPGHHASDFESPVYSQILVNALNWQP